MFLKQSKKDQCLQIQLLKLNIQFTEEVEELLSDPQDQPKKFQLLSKNLMNRIEDKYKDHIPKSNLQSMFMVLLFQRDRCSSLQKSSAIAPLDKESFEWLRHPRFFNHTIGDGKKISKIDVKVSILNESYQYQFGFIQKACFVYADSIFVGNCIVGKTGFAKK